MTTPCRADQSFRLRLENKPRHQPTTRTPTQPIPPDFASWCLLPHLPFQLRLLINTSSLCLSAVFCSLLTLQSTAAAISNIQYSDRAINTDTQPPALIIDRVAILKPPVQRLHPATSSPDYPRRRNQHRGCQRGSGSTKHRRSPQAREPTFLKVKPARPGPTEVASDSDTGFSPSTPPDKISIKKKHGEGGKYPPYPYIFRSKHQYINTSLYPRTYPSQSFTNHQYIYTHQHQHIPLRHITTHLNTTSQHPPRQAHHSSP